VRSSAALRAQALRILVAGYELPDIGIAHYDSDEDYDDEGEDECPPRRRHGGGVVGRSPWSLAD